MRQALAQLSVEEPLLEEQGTPSLYTPLVISAAPDQPGSAADAGSVEQAIDLDQAYRMYSRLVASIGLKILGRQEEVEDLVQDVFLEARRWLKRLRSSAAFKSWLITVTVRASRRRLRRRRFKALLGLDAVPGGYEDVVDESASEQDRSVIADVYRILDSLPSNQRIAWALRYIDDEPLNVVAMHCGCSLATAKRRVSAAHQAIVEAMNR